MMRALPFPLALAAMYGPVYGAMVLGPWQSPEQSHAPIIALIVAWLAWRARDTLRNVSRPAPLAGLVVLTIGVAVFVMGKLLASPLLTLASQLPVFAGVVLTLGGPPWLRTLRFPLVFLLFMLPLPGVFVDAATAPLKEGISRCAEELLRQAGYPVARSGVVLHLSQYRLLVDDACSGLYSMIFLAALGALFAHLAGIRSRLHRVLLLVCSLPVAIVANLIRVLLISLTTYHAGDRIGQGPIHDLAGVVMFLVALSMLLTLDALLRQWLPERTSLTASPAPTTAKPALLGRYQVLVALPLLAAASFTTALESGMPNANAATAKDLHAMVPKSFGHWKLDDSAVPSPISANAALKATAAYAQTLARVYVDDSGHRIMLSLVYSQRQADERWQMHRPEYCYAAQGFALRAIADERLVTTRGLLPLRRLQAERPGRLEAVSYWLTIGDEAVLPGLSRKWAQLRQRINGDAPDGMMVRVSSLDAAPPAAHALHNRFISDLVASLPENTARRFVGNHLSGERHGMLF